MKHFTTRFVRRIVPAGFLSVGLYGFATTLTTPVSSPKVDYATDIQPIFNAHCLPCHSATSKMGGLVLESGKALMQSKIAIPNRSSESRLMDRLLGKKGLPRMPMGFGSLRESDIALIKSWIDQGCVVTENKRAHWAYLNPTLPIIPNVKNVGWVKNPIDAFVLDKQREVNLSPSPEADKTTLLRRVTLDLIGLPPTPAEVDAFLADKSPNAYEKVVDRLFANPHYGERMALPWLDAARYADSNGFQQDGDTYQYVWRDWVVSAMNRNMPFDQFAIQQLAGDLLPGADQASRDGINKLVATGFVRNNMLNGEGGAIPEEQRNVALFDRVDTCSTTFLGLTMACARCHDHKYDPISQKDYYSMLAFFNNVPESGIPSDNMGGYYYAQPWIYVGSPSEMDRLHRLEPLIADVKDQVQKLTEGPEGVSAQALWEASPETIKTIPKELAPVLKTEVKARKADAARKLHEYYLEHGLFGPAKEARTKLVALQKELDELRVKLPKVMIMSDRQPRKTHIFSRGNYESPLAEVTPATPAALPAMSKSDPKNRLGLAKWIVNPDNPLTARVQVNRYWMLFFGKGLVKTVENFGVQSEKPVNQELLDWLAVEFRESGWNVKHIQKLIVMSSTYRQSSKVTKGQLKIDPENRYLARGARFRMPSMLIRDEALAASGLINLQVGGKPVYPYQPKGIWDGLNITDERDFSYPQSKGADLYRRSIYTFWRRTVGPGNMFDSASRQVCTVRQSHTSTPLHALTTLNDVTWVEAGRALADIVLRTKVATDEWRLADAFRRVCSRRPTESEIKILKRSLARSQTAFRADPKAAELFLKQGETPRDKSLDPIVEAAYANVCLAILNLDEALTKE